ncbi:MAG: HD domain-containing protein [Muribaculaceae bacterium]|nr:HD domain-containing protein [Muribaculaceae bacterium]
MNTALYHRICQWLRDLIKDTPWEGHVFAVGGCCRDALMGREIKDVDLAVDLPNGGVEFARWLHTRRLTAGRPIYFEKYGTARLVLKAFPHDEIELVQTRKEKYTDRTSRNPEVVSGTLRDDCFRRDFTVNTLYHDISRDETIDLTGRGAEDIRAGILRTPDDPDVTFDDDPVRILRCIRFAARFGWTIEESTLRALYNNVDRLSIVSRERCRGELGKMLTDPDPAEALRLLADTGAIRYLLPLLAEMAPSKDHPEKVPGLWHHSVDSVAAVAAMGEDSTELRMAAFLHDIGKLRTRVKDRKGTVRYPRHELIGGEMVHKALRGLKFEHEPLKEICFLIRHHADTEEWGDMAEDMTDRRLRALQNTCASPQRLERLLKLITAIGSAPATQTARIRVRSAELQDEGSDAFSREAAPADSPKVEYVRRRHGSGRRGRRRPRSKGAS